MMLNELRPNTNHISPLLDVSSPSVAVFIRGSYTVVSLYLASDGQCGGKGLELMMLII